MSIKFYLNTKKHKEKKERMKEIDYKCEMMELESKAKKLLKSIRHYKDLAIMAEKNGDHQLALTHAAAAAYAEKSHKSAMENIRKCKRIHERTKAQKEMNDVIRTCSGLIKQVGEDIDVDQTIRLHNEHEHRMAELEQKQAAMDSVQDNYLTAADEYESDLEGELFLSELMAQEAGPVQPAQKQEEPAKKEEKHSILPKEWAHERRQMLSELA